MTHKFIIAGPSQPQEAPGVKRAGKYNIIYDPKKTKEFKNYVKMCCAQQWGGRLPLQGAIEMKIIFNFLRPKSISKKVKHHVKKPDLKNLLASLEDGMKQIVFHDDNQIMRTVMEKRYSDVANTIVIISTVE